MPAASTTLYNRDKCRQRSRLAARQGREAVPVKLAGSKPPSQPAKATLISARGQMPTGAAALARINTMLGREDDPLTEDQVHVRYLEAGNTNYVPSHLFFLAPSTLKNISQAANDGFAMMNSHRTGGLSSPSELPMGRTFAGRYESWALEGGSQFSRVLLGVYMLQGEYPNGESGPSTDALANGIDAGTVFDVSLGLIGPYDLTCDVCGFDMKAMDEEGRYLCLHVPGTTRRMNAEQQTAQKGRGVSNGVATYTVHNASANEISAVYDGAVPGAGFRRAMAAVKGGLLNAQELGQVQLAYGHLLDIRGGVSRRTFDLGRVTLSANEMGNPMARKISLAGLLDRLRNSGQDPEDIDIDLEDDQPARLSAGKAPTSGTAEQSSGSSRTPDPEVVQLRQELAETTRQLKAAEERRIAGERSAKLATIDADVQSFVKTEQDADRLTGEQVKALSPALRQAAIDDLDHPVEGFSRLATLKTLQSAAKPHGLSKEGIAGGSKPQTTVLSHNGEQGDYDPVKAAREQNDRVLGAKGIKPSR